MDYKAPDQNLAKTYWRPIKDIDKAVDELRTSIRQQSTLDFLAYFFGCEKLAVAIVGMSQGLDATHDADQFVLNIRPAFSQPLQRWHVVRCAGALHRGSRRHIPAPQ